MNRLEATSDAIMEGSTDTRPPTLLTVEQAAELLNVSVRFVRRLIAERRIAVHRIGRHVRISGADLNAYITSGRVEPLPGSGDPRRSA